MTEIRTYRDTRLEFGVYRIYWKNPDPEAPPYSVGSVGHDREGRYWLAPANWIGGVPTFDWSKVDRVELIEAWPPGRSGHD
jgi:hypothetical protein